MNEKSLHIDIFAIMMEKGQKSGAKRELTTQNEANRTL